MSEITAIFLSRNRFESEILTEAIRAEGFTVELVHDLSAEASTGSGGASKLYVHADDIEAITAVIARSHALDD